jgi:predicted ATPase
MDDDYHVQILYYHHRQLCMSKETARNEIYREREREKEGERTTCKLICFVSQQIHNKNIIIQSYM